MKYHQNKCLNKFSRTYIFYEKLWRICFHNFNFRTKSLEILSTPKNGANVEQILACQIFFSQIACPQISLQISSLQIAFLQIDFLQIDFLQIDFLQIEKWTF